MKVVATRHFTVGPVRAIAIAAGGIREVQPDVFGNFSTVSDSGHYFGVCKLGDGWELVTDSTPER